MGSRLLTFPLMILLIGRPPASAGPLLGKGRPAGPLAEVYPDAADPRVFYYPPGRLRLAESADGGPDLRFLQLVYMGAEATGDPGRFVARSVLSFRVVHQAPPAADLQGARQALPAGARLLPLPIRRMETRLVWTPLAESEPSPASTAVDGGRLEEGESPAGGDGYWSERVFTLSPDPFSSQALWDGFHKGHLLVSLAYAFWAEGDGEGPQGKPALSPIRADAMAVVVDAVRFPDRFKRIDLNQGLPAGYAALDVRCYDFDNGLRPDLGLKIVEVEALAVSGQRVTRSVRFRRSAPDVTAASLRFPYAVRLDRPFRFRVREIAGDGTATATPWQEHGDWARLLDVTSGPPAPRPLAESKPEEDRP